MRQGTGKDDIKYFVQKKNNKKDGTCPQGWLAESNAGLSKGTYTTIEENSTNQCYNNYLLPTDYTNSTCLQAGDCDDSKNKCPPPCNVQGGHGRCLSKVNNQNKRNCVGGDSFCGVNLTAHTKLHKNDTTCDSLLQYADKMIECEPGYTAFVEPNQDNCVFKCGDDGLGKCCATSTNTYSTKDPTNPPEQQCKLAGPDKTACGKLDPDCTWTIPTATQPTKTTTFGCIVEP